MINKDQKDRQRPPTVEWRPSYGASYRQELGRTKRGTYYDKSPQPIPLRVKIYGITVLVLLGFSEAICDGIYNALVWVLG